MISGRGSNLCAILQAIADKTLDADVKMVISNSSDAAGLKYARNAGVPTQVIHAPAKEFEQQAQNIIDTVVPRLVVLAGFMKILSAQFVDHYRERLINIHPALLPAFPGLHTHRRAIEAGVGEHGASVHMVIPAVDAGPIIAQVKLNVLPCDDEQTLANRVLIQEHKLYPKCLQWFAQNRIRVQQHAAFLDDQPLPIVYSEQL